MTTESLRLPGAAFDELAASYDASFTTTALGRWLRAAVWERLDARFTGRRRILDIGCGTGEDAVHLASRGHEVVAADVSAPMLELAAEKARRAGCAERVDLRRVPMERLAAELAGERFDGVCSNFGAVNCAPQVDRLIAAIAPLIEPGAPLVWVVMGRHVPWEWAWFLARGDRRRAFRRLSREGASWRGLRIAYPTPGQLARAMRPHFRPDRRLALGLVLPPSYAARWLEHSPRTFALLARLERAASGWQPLAGLADHYVLEATRSPEHGDA